MGSNHVRNAEEGGRRAVEQEVRQKPSTAAKRNAILDSMVGFYRFGTQFLRERDFEGPHCIILVPHQCVREGASKIHDFDRKSKRTNDISGYKIEARILYYFSTGMPTVFQNYLKTNLEAIRGVIFQTLGSFVRGLIFDYFVIDNKAIEHM